MEYRASNAMSELLIYYKNRWMLWPDPHPDPHPIDGCCGPTRIPLLNAVKKRHPPEGLIFHSDRGIEYCAYRYHDVLDRYGIVHSVDRPGCCQDNAHMEPFFHSLKGELIHKRKIKNTKHLANLIKGYIVHFYNKKRLHSALNYCSPVEFERMAS